MDLEWQTKAEISIIIYINKLTVKFGLVWYIFINSCLFLKILEKIFLFLVFFRKKIFIYIFSTVKEVIL